jgi:cytochrome c oxidase accessory protein FixG
MTQSQAPGATPPLNQDPNDSTLYKKREKIYPREVTGVFANLRNLTVVVLLGIYYGLPWINLGGQQALLLDLPARKFHLFGLTLWPQDLIYLSALLIIAALSLFFFTALAGRLWCGYACPQTVWTEVFIIIERWIEGGRQQQMKLDKEPRPGRRLRLRAMKQTAWILFSLWTGFTFVGYFTPIRELSHNVLAWNLGPWETFWIFFYSFATWGNAGMLREQVCIYMCPYARFQSAMFDRDTLLIAYDTARGEPRGQRKRGVDARSAGLGDCIDCGLCVQACPTGIDIRNGLQYQCIGCAACIDVCNEVMEKVGSPKGLVRYTTERALEGGKTHVLRPRIMVYAGGLLFLFLALGIALANRTPIELDILRDRNALFNETNEGWIENVYTLKLINMIDAPRTFRVSASGVPGLKLVSKEGTELKVDGGGVRAVAVSLQADPAELKATSTKIELTMEAIEEPGVRLTRVGRFLGPPPAR